MAERVLDIPQPLLGLDRRRAYQLQAPGSTPDCVNVRPDASIQGRTRMGSRPSLMRAYDVSGSALGSPSSINMLGQVRGVASSGALTWLEQFDSSPLGGVWSVAAWNGDDGNPLTLPVISGDGFAMALVDPDDEVGAVRDAFSDIDGSSPVSVGILCTPFTTGESIPKFSGIYSVFMKLNDNTPDGRTDGIEVAMAATGSGVGKAGVPYVVVMRTWNNGAFVHTQVAGLMSVEPAWLNINLTGNSLTVHLKGTLIATRDITGELGGGAGNRVGFGIHMTVALPEIVRAQIDTFRVLYSSTETETTEGFPNRLVASAGEKLYIDDAEQPGVVALTGHTPALTLIGDRLLHATPSRGKLWIADYGNVRTQHDDGLIEEANGTVLDSASVADWTAVGIEVLNDVAVLSHFSATEGTFVPGTYEIASIVAGELTLTRSVYPPSGLPGTQSAGVTFRIMRGPKSYDPITNKLTLIVADLITAAENASGSGSPYEGETVGVSKGQAPTGCPLIAVFADRLILAGQTDFPHLWYASRKGDYLDWDFGRPADDTAQAVAGAASDAGIIGEPLTALAVHSSDYMVLSTLSELWVLRGDPYLGSLVNLSRTIGIVSSGAWCHGPGGELIFLSRDGLYVIGPGPGSTPQSLSRERMPEELIDIDTANTRVLLAYDIRARGVHIYLTPVDATTRLHFWYDMELRAFTPFEHDNDHEPFSVLEFESDSPTDRAVLLGGRDGFIRKFSAASPAHADDGVNFRSALLLGPFRMGESDFHLGALSRLSCALAEDSGDVAWSVYVGASAEAAFDRYDAGTADVSGTFNKGFNPHVRPRRRGHSFLIELSVSADDDSSAWALERIGAGLKDAGVQRA